MNDYIETALAFIESEEMREYIRNELQADKEESTELVSEFDCSYFVVGSRAGIEEKLAALRKMPRTIDNQDMINAAETALAEKAKSTNDVFLATLHFPYETGNSETWEDRKPFLSFEAVEKWIHQMTEKQCDIFEETVEQCMERVWYEVEKFIPDENDELSHKITWILNAKGEIIFFELGDDYARDGTTLKEEYYDDWLAWVTWEGSADWSHNLMPFDFGDIITIDMRPFYDDFRGVVVRIGNNRGCCAIACIHCDKDGYLHCSTLRHGNRCYLAKVSSLYRAKRFVDELPENEKALKTISESIKKVPATEKVLEDKSVWRNNELADQYDDYLYDQDYERQKDHLGCSWDEFRERFRF